MHGLDEAQIGARELGEHLHTQIGDEAVAEIGDGDVGDIFGDRLDQRHGEDGGRDPVDRVRVLGGEHVVRRALDEEGDGAGSRRCQQHGQRSDHEQPEARAQMLPPNAPDDVAGRVMDVELVGRPADRASVSEEMVLQAFPRSCGQGEPPHRSRPF